jgi:hypothetical protein
MLKKNWFLKMLMLMTGIAVSNVVDGEGGGGDGIADEIKPVEVEEIKEDISPKGEEKEKENSLSDGEAKLLRELMEKKGALKDTKDQLAQLKAQLSQFDGINLDEVKALLKERDETVNSQLEAKGEWDRLKNNLLEQHTTEKTALESKIQALQTELDGKESSIHGLTIGSAFSGSKYIAEELTLTPSKAQIVYGSHFEFQDGKIVGYDKPRGSAERTQLINSSGEPLNFDQAVAKIIENDADREYLIRSKAKPGANSGTVDGVVRQIKEVNGISRIAAALTPN